MVKAIESAGVTLSVSAGSPTAFLAVGNITAIRGAGEGAGVVDITNVEDTRKRKLVEIPDEGRVTLDVNYDPDKTTHATLRQARRSRTLLEFQIRLTDAANTLLTFFGYVTAFSLIAATSQAVLAALTIEVTGATTDDYVGWHPVGDITFNPSAKNDHVILSNGNLTATGDNSTNNRFSVLGTGYAATGQRYYEATIQSGIGADWVVGITKSTFVFASSDMVGTPAGNGIGYKEDARKFIEGAGSAYGATYGNGDVIGVLYDSSAGTLTFWKNGVSQGVAASGLSGSYAPAVSVFKDDSITANFGGSAWVYTPPAGYTGWTV